MGRCSHGGEGANQRQSEAGSCGRHGEPGAGRPVRGECVQTVGVCAEGTMSLAVPVSGLPRAAGGQTVGPFVMKLNYFIVKTNKS